MPQSQCILGSHDQCEFPPFFKGHWQSPSTAITAGKCLPLGLCKETVKESTGVYSMVTAGWWMSGKYGCVMDIVLCKDNTTTHWHRWYKVVRYIHAPSAIILRMPPANERRRYNVTSSLIGWVHATNHPCTILYQWVNKNSRAYHGP